MEGGYSVMGYQHNGKYMTRQMKAVYDMFHGIGMKYVSDVFAFKEYAQCLI